MDKTLMQISDELLEVERQLVESDGEVDTVLEAFFDTVMANRNEKLDNYAALIDELEARAEVRKANASRQQELSRSDDNLARHLKERLKFFFEQHGLKKVETDRYRITLRKAGGKAPVIIDNEQEVPKKHKSVEITHRINKDSVRNELEEGVTVPGARLGERSTYIHIK